MGKKIKLPKGIKWAFAEGCRTEKEARKALTSFQGGFKKFDRAVRKLEEPLRYRTIGPEALDKYVGDEVRILNKDKYGGIPKGKLVDSVPRGSYFVGRAEESDFYVAERSLLGVTFYIPIKHGDRIKVRQNPDQRRTSCVREYVFIDESD